MGVITDCGYFVSLAEILCVLMYDGVKAVRISFYGEATSMEVRTRSRSTCLSTAVKVGYSLMYLEHFIDF